MTSQFGHSLVKLYLFECGLLRTFANAKLLRNANGVQFSVLTVTVYESGNSGINTAESSTSSARIWNLPIPKSSQTRTMSEHRCGVRVREKAPNIATKIE